MEFADAAAHNEEVFRSTVRVLHLSAVATLGALQEDLATDRREFPDVRTHTVVVHEEASIQTSSL
jgi:hypothetical protein